MALLRWSIGSGIETDRTRISSPDSSAPAGYRFPREVIAVAVRWYLRYGLRNIGHASPWTARWRASFEVRTAASLGWLADQKKMLVRSV
jgi:hypothetical protein